MNLRDAGRQICSEISRVIASVDDAGVGLLADALVGAPRIFVAGQGRTGLVARCLAMRLAHLGLNVSVVGDATTPRARPDDLVLICTGSGQTPGLVCIAQATKKAGARVAVITAVPGSLIAQEADVVVSLPAPTPKTDLATGASSVQPMGSLFEQALLVFADALVMTLAERLNQTADQMWQRHANLE
jgi:6-phospho-3-hexuloisomerase